VPLNIRILGLYKSFVVFIIILIFSLLFLLFNTVGRGLRFSRNDRTVEVIKLFIIWLLNWRTELIIRAEVVNLLLAMGAFTDSFIVSNPGLNYTVRELHLCVTYSVKYRFLLTREKWLSQPRKADILVSWCHNSMGEFFRCFKIVRETNVDLSVTENTNASECTRLRITRSSHSLSTIYLRPLHSGIYGWTLQALWTSKSPAVVGNTATDRKSPDYLHLLVLKRRNLFDEDCDGVRYFGNCCG